MTPKEPDNQWFGHTDADAKKERAATNAHVAKLSAHWQAEHKKRSKALENELLKEHKNASTDERLLVQAVAHDLALAETLGQTEVQLAQRALALVDNPRHVLALAKALKAIAGSRETATRRAQELLVTAGVLRGQRKLAEVPHLRRVA